MSRVRIPSLAPFFCTGPHPHDRSANQGFSAPSAPKRRAALRLPTTMVPAEAFVAFGTIGISPATVPISMIIPVPVGRRAPVSTCPHPMVVPPSPSPTDPDVTRHGASRRHLYYRSRDGRGYDDWRRSDDNRGRHRDSKVDSETNPGICSRDSQCSQGQNCDSLFHNVYPFGVPAKQNTVTTGLLFCKATKWNDRTQKSGEKPRTPACLVDEMRISG